MANIQVDEEFLDTLEDAVANGANTIDSQAKALGLTNTTYQKLYYGKRKNGKEEKGKICDAIKRGVSRSYPALLRLTEREYIKRLQGYYVTEEETNIFYQEGEEISRQVKKKKRWVQASPTEFIFALVNASKESAKWESINKVIQTTGDDEKFEVTFKAED